MKNDDYKTEFEEHRKEISLDEGHEGSDVPLRSELHRKGRKSKKKSSHTMINVILGLFTLIPVLILVYIISDFYTPGDRTSAKGGDTGTLYEMNNEKSDENIAVADEDGEKKETSKEDEKSAGKTETTTVDKPVVNVNPPSEKKPEVIVESKPEIKPEVKPEPKPVAKEHTVGSSENLYRISLKYYGNGEGVAKIKSANGLSSNEIRVGQRLVIP